MFLNIAPYQHHLVIFSPELAVTVSRGVDTCSTLGYIVKFNKNWGAKDTFTPALINIEGASFSLISYYNIVYLIIP